MKKIVSLLLVLSLLVCVMPLMTYAEDSTSFCVTHSVTAVNTERTASSIIVYSSEYGESTKTTGLGVEYTVNTQGEVTAIDKNNSKIPADGFVISVGPSKRTQMPAVKIGDTVYYDQEYNLVTFISKDYNPFSVETFNYDAINAVRAENKLIIYRDKATSGTNTWGYEAVVDADGMIISVGGNNNAIPENGFVISGVGTRKQDVERICKLGYFAVLDEEAKTVTVSYTKENAASRFFLQLKDTSEKYNHAYISYADVDIDTAKASLESLDGIYEKIQNALSNDDVKEFITLSNAFYKENEKIEDLLIPYVPVETRALWLRIPTSNSKATVEKTVKEIYDMGFNSVCIEILFDSTTIMPMPEESLFEQNPIFKGTDMLKLYIDEFHKYGIEVHAWMSCYRVGHDGSNNVSLSVGKKKPEWLNIDQNGKVNVTNEYGNAYFLNPALPEVQSFLLENYRYILEHYAIDGFQLDYVRYPENSTVNYGYDEYTKSEFLKEYNFKSVPTNQNQAGWKEWCQFRASFVTKLVTDTRDLIKSVRPDVLFSCDVAPDYASSMSKMCQDTETWLKEGLVDIVYPMAYGTTDAVTKWTDNTVNLCADSTQTVIGLRDNGAEIYREQIIAARSCGADGTAFFSYSQYVAADYSLITETIFSKPAVCPSYNAKNAVLAQLKHIGETYEKRIRSNAINIDLTEAEKISEKANDLYEKLENSDIEALRTEIMTFISEGREIATKYNSENTYSQGIANYLNYAFDVIEKTVKNSRDELKKSYNSPSVEEGAPESNSQDSESESNNENKSNGVERVFQILFIVIMTIGVAGLPLYYFLNTRKNRIAKENQEESKEENDSHESDDNESKND